MQTYVRRVSGEQTAMESGKGRVAYITRPDTVFSKFETPPCAIFFEWMIFGLHRFVGQRVNPPSSFPVHILTKSFSSSSVLFVKKRMPPKKAQAPEKKTLLGRPSNNLKIGIVGLFAQNVFFSFSHTFFSLGLPNVGKSSFFNALSDTGTSRRFFSSIAV